MRPGSAYLRLPENPYLREFRAVGGGGWDDYAHRQRLVYRYAWAVPDDGAIQAIADLRMGVVEAGAGGGYWARMMRSVGIDVIAYDAEPYSNDQANSRWTEVLVGGVSQVAAHPDRALMLCWPPYNTRMAYEHLVEWAVAGGRVLIYVGEHFGGCNANDMFFGCVDDNFVRMRAVDIPCWHGLHDYLAIFVRRDQPFRP